MIFNGLTQGLQAQTLFYGIAQYHKRKIEISLIFCIKYDYINNILYTPQNTILVIYTTLPIPIILESNNKV